RGGGRGRDGRRRDRIGAPVYQPTHRAAVVDRARLAERGFILPEDRPGRLAEEFRVVKRQLLLAAAGRDGGPIENGRLILVCSASPDEGKTFCSVNLALSMAREPELDVVLIDGDFSKPEVVSTFGLDDGPGLMDALADHALDVESCLIATDIPRLSVLPAGTRCDDATELIASNRTRDVFARLLDRSPARIVIFDSPPALSASPASVLALHAGQTVMVVKADQTSEAELREAIAMLDGCQRIQLLLNAASFAPGGRRFGSYYGYGDAS
ncbi:MAG: AAA family ATPase, partial [Sphingomonadaceae bacterium]|nr:AAA family ATPase [Sphingomonadaceae bacterium]